MTSFPKIYMVEDDKTIQELLKKHLAHSYQVTCVSNFRDIKNEVLALDPDLILMDITLPFYNGFSYCKSNISYFFIALFHLEILAIPQKNDFFTRIYLCKSIKSINITN